MSPAEIKARLAAVKKELGEIEAQVAEAARLAALGAPIDQEAWRWRDRRTQELALVCHGFRIEAALLRTGKSGRARA